MNTQEDKVLGANASAEEIRKELFEGENIKVNNGDNCMTAGPIQINNGSTITINNGGSWSIV